MKQLRALVLAGGSGTRLWPITRHIPKQVVPFRESTLLEQTLDRIAPCAQAGITIVTTQEYESIITPYTQKYSVDWCIEPQGRNTALAIAYAITDPKLHDDTMLCITPSDHYIDDAALFQKGIVDGAEWAYNNGRLVLFGVRPHTASSLYGYIGCSAAQSEPYRVDRFIEKPSKDRAQELLAEEDLFWNCGIIVASAALLRFLYKKHAYDEYYAASEARNNNRALWMSCPARSIDRALLEHAENLAMMPLGSGWADVGSVEQFLRYSGGFYSSKGRTIINETSQNIGVIDMDESIIVAPLDCIDSVMVRWQTLYKENAL